MRKAYVEWWDAQSESDNVWTPVKDCKGSLALCYSLGFIVKETPEAITIAGHTDWEYQDFSGEISIPVSCIKKIEYLGVTEGSTLGLHPDSSGALPDTSTKSVSS